MRFNKKKLLSKLDIKDVQLFYKSLKKFKKNHPDFDIERVMKKLYPTIDPNDTVI